MTITRRLRYLLEFIAVWCLVKLFGLLPLDTASALGGAIARTLGPRLGVSRRAARNIERALPEKTPAEVKAIVYGMWDNLGRTAAEIPHFARLDMYDGSGRFEFVDGDIIDNLRDDDIGAVFFTGHVGNWELTALSVLQRGLPLTTVYRQANNPYVEKFLSELRRPVSGTMLVPKGSKGARSLISALKNNDHLGLLVDQKMNDGIAVPFFGRDAMTAPALAQLAMRFNVPIVPGRNVRLGGARFRVIYEHAIEPANTGNRDEDVRETMRRVNAHIEGWIREHPEQWLWLHNRWPDDNKETET